MPSTYDPREEMNTKREYMGYRVRPIQVIGELAFVPLTQGRAAMIDAKDAELVGRWNWLLQRGPYTNYATRRGGKMHRILCGVPSGDAREVDHINHNGLDNRRCNLRICSKSQNQHNRKPLAGRSSQFKGVTWRADRGCWRSEIKSGGKKYSLGSFASEVEAAYAYDEAATRIIGEFAYVNFPGDGK